MTIKADGDMAWLKKYRPQRNLLDAGNERVKSIMHMISSSSVDQWPMTIGLFGGWGSGKTTLLSFLADELEASKSDKKSYNVIYFNAWKYAGFTEVIPALIYKVLKSLDKTDNVAMITKIMTSLGAKYSNQLGEWLQKFIGVNPVELYDDISSIKDDIEKNNYDVGQYYTQVDKAQDLLQKFFEKQETPTVVLIDELDRCDPGEAFEAIKQLRVFFSMRNVPIVFILSANPEPIGLAVKHQYGLKKDINDYEAKRILEKYVDTYIDMSDPHSLNAFVRNIWSCEYNDRIHALSFIHRIDAELGETNPPSFLNSSAFQAINTNNYLYSNIRVMQKSYSYICACREKSSGFKWVIWHLELLSQIQEDLRRDVALLASFIGEISCYALLYTIKEINNAGVLNVDGSINKEGILDTPKGKTAFSIYRSFFWEQTRTKLIKSADEYTFESEKQYAALEKIFQDYHVMDFIIIMSLIPFQSGSVKKSLESQKVLPDDWQEFGNFRHYSWLLANY